MCKSDVKLQRFIQYTHCANARATIRIFVYMATLFKLFVHLIKYSMGNAVHVTKHLINKTIHMVKLPCLVCNVFLPRFLGSGTENYSNRRSRLSFAHSILHTPSKLIECFSACVRIQPPPVWFSGTPASVSFFPV